MPKLSIFMYPGEYDAPLQVTQLVGAIFYYIYAILIYK